jgi:hypothetical protein
MLAPRHRARNRLSVFYLPHDQLGRARYRGGHYQEIVGGPVDPTNEIWPLFTSDEEGVGNGKAVHAFTARPEAQAVVIHAPGGARIACADLQ